MKDKGRTEKELNNELIKLRKRLSKLEASQALLSLHYNIKHVLNESGSVAHAIEKILEVVFECNIWGIGEVWFLSPEGDCLQLYCQRYKQELNITEFSTVSRNVTFKYGEGLPGHVWEKGEPAWVTDVEIDNDFLRKDIASRLGLHTAFAFPIKGLERVLGVILFFSKKFEKPEDDLLSMFSIIGGQIGNFIERKQTEELIKLHNEELEKRVKERTRDLEEAKVFAEIANRVKSDFLANMSHELRTPLNSIIGFSEIMLEGMVGDMTDEQRRSLKNIYESGKNLHSLIDEILEFSKIDAGLKGLERNSISLRKCCENIMEKFRDKLMNRNIEFKIDIEEGLKDIVADEDKIKRVIFNLLDNAIKFTPDKGRVLLKASSIPDFGLRISELKEVGKISLSENGKFSDIIPQPAIEITVEDTGIGITPEDQERLFQPFHQLEPVMTKRYSGIGLGLYLSKKCIELHGGVIWAESEKGKGSRFSFLIPVEH